MSVEPPFQIVARGPGRVEWSESTIVRDLTPKTISLVDTMWEEAVEQSGGRLFNGTFLNFIGIDFGRGTWTVRTQFEEYKYLLAQRLRRDLELGVIPIGVSGVCFVDNSVCIAQRSDHMTQYPGWLELVPSGTIDNLFARDDRTVDVAGKLLDEFEEETRLDRSCVASCEMIGLILDVPDNNYDICFELHLRCTRQAVLDGLSVPGEYQSPLLVERAQLNDFIGANKERIIPTSLAISELLSSSGSGT